MHSQPSDFFTIFFHTKIYFLYNFLGPQDLPPNPETLPMMSYNKVHDPKNPNAWGAYIAEILGMGFLGRDVFVGDGQNTLGTVHVLRHHFLRGVGAQGDHKMSIFLTLTFNNYYIFVKKRGRRVRKCQFWLIFHSG